MSIKQLSVVIDDSIGKLFEMTSLFNEKELDIRSIWVSQESGFAVAHIIVDKPLIAYEALKFSGYFVKMVDVFALRADNQPGVLMRILEILKAHNLNIEYLYGLNKKNEENAIIIFRTNDIVEAVQALKAGHLEFLPTKKTEDAHKKVPSWEIIESL